MVTVADSLPLVLVGLSHHTAPVHVRERMALDAEGVRAELTSLRTAHLAREAMLLSTCNRVELYAVPEPGHAERLRDHLMHRRVGGETLDPYLYWRSGRDAVRHLFRVASSLDSLVVGEPQILGQVKDAVRLANDSGALGGVLHRLTQRSLWVAKQVRTHTEIGRANVGIGNAGVYLAQQIFSSLQGRRAMLIGTGEMGRQVAQAMVNTGLEELLVANRTFATAVEVAEAFGGTPLHLDRVDDYLHRVDIVITATAATRPILDARQVAHALRVRRYKPLFLVDLSVPRNIDPAVDALDQAYLFNVDDLTQVTEAGKRARSDASVQAEAMVDLEVDRFSRRLADLAINDGIGALMRKVDDLRELELSRSQRVLEGLDAEQRAAIEVMMRAFSKRVMHGPLARIRHAARQGDHDAVADLLATWDIDVDPQDG